MTIDALPQLENNSAAENGRENSAMFEDAYAQFRVAFDTSKYLDLQSMDFNQLRDALKPGGRLMIDGPGFSLDLNVKVEGNQIKVQDYVNRGEFRDFKPLFDRLQTIPNTTRFLRNLEA